MKRYSKILVIFVVFIITSCGKLYPSLDKSNNKGIDQIGKQIDKQEKVNKPDTLDEADNTSPAANKAYSITNETGNTISERFNVPEGFARVDVAEASFGEYLRNLPLKPHGTPVHYFDGREKPLHVHQAVIDMDVGDRDLQQCADAVMRLRGEYLYGKKLYDQIHFNFVNGFKAEYKKWMEGYRVSVDGNKTGWVKKTDFSDEYKDFRKYMDIVFAYAGTLSLAQELEPVEISSMEIGHVFIQGGSPGHCVIVADMAENKATGEKIFMIAQSYMPAQDIHILKNLGEEAISPWYRLDFGDTLRTPEWTFQKEDIKRFEP